MLAYASALVLLSGPRGPASHHPTDPRGDEDRGYCPLNSSRATASRATESLIAHPGLF